MRRIAYLTPLYFADESYIGGGERYPLNLAIGVAESSDGEFEVEILSFGPRPVVRDLHPGVRLRVLPTAYRPQNPLDQLSWDLPDAIADADLVHIHQAYTRPSEVGIVLARLSGKPVCVTDHGGPSSPIGIEFGSLDLVDRVVCQSDFAASMLRTTAPVTIVKGGVDARLFAPLVPRPVRDRVVFVGRLLPHKGVDQLIRALPPDLLLTCCGRVYRDEYFEVLKRLAAGKRVEFLTDASDATIREMYARAHASVLPSTYRDYYGTNHVQPELMGFTLLEAMACGTPVICSRVGGMPEFVRHGETGFVFDSESELTGYLQLLAGDPARVERMGFRARKVIESEYDLRVCGAELVTLYTELIDAPARGGRMAA
jgi:glycosyltransferase involved in cell wall biosynthesis